MHWCVIFVRAFNPCAVLCEPNISSTILSSIPDKLWKFWLFIPNQWGIWPWNRPIWRGIWSSIFKIVKCLGVFPGGDDHFWNWPRHKLWGKYNMEFLRESKSVYFWRFFPRRNFRTYPGVSVVGVQRHKERPRWAPGKAPVFFAKRAFVFCLPVSWSPSPTGENPYKRLGTSTRQPSRKTGVWELLRGTPGRNLVDKRHMHGDRALKKNATKGRYISTFSL